LNPDQETYDTVSTSTHKVEKDVNRTLTRLYHAIAETRSRFGHDAVIVLSMSVNVPSRRLSTHNEEHL
jgi:hypothetical protein